MKRVESGLPPGLPGCPGCAARDRRIAELEARVAELEALVAKLEAQVAKLAERVGQNSGNSGKPPSSDGPEAPKRPKKEPTGRKRGGQPGHEGATRELLPIEQVDDVKVYRPDNCERCQEPLPQEAGKDDPAPRRHQVHELREKPCQVTEHQACGSTCQNCGHVTYAEMPAEVAGSCMGPKLAATAALLTAGCQSSRRQVEEIFEDVLGVPISVGTVSNLEKEMSAALEPVHQAAGAHVREARAKNLDETGWKKKGDKCWLWACATATVAFFVIHPRRGKAGFRALMGRALKGIFSSDRWHTYNARARRRRQICWAHLIRDFQKLIDRGGESARIGRKAKDISTLVFMAWKDFKTGGIDRETLKQCLRPLQTDFELLMRQGTKVPHHATATFCKNLLELGPALWTFVHVEGVEPTNNHVERVLRRAVIWRKRSFGSDSEDGCRFVERVLTVVVSRRLQKLPVLAFLEAAIRAHRARQPAPALLPA